MENQKLKKFVKIFAILFFILGGLTLLRGHIFLAGIFCYLSFSILFLALIRIQLLEPIYDFWLFVGEKIGKFNTIIILLMIYYLLFVPVGIILKIFNRDLLQRKINSKEDTYWIKRDKIKFKRSAMEHMY